MWNYLVDKSVLQIFLCWDVTSPPFAPLSCTHSVKCAINLQFTVEYLLLLSITSVLVVDLSLRVIGFVVFPIGLCRQSWQMMLVPIEKRHFGRYGIILWITVWIVFPSHATDETITKLWWPSSRATLTPSQKSMWRRRHERNKWVDCVERSGIRVGVKTPTI